jgi:hypothetical protein
VAALVAKPFTCVEAFEASIKNCLFEHIGNAAPIDDITLLIVERQVVRGEEAN